jgi:hypothetical protein
VISLSQLDDTEAGTRSSIDQLLGIRIEPNVNFSCLLILSPATVQDQRYVPERTRHGRAMSDFKLQ